jgi:hypothetical protein
MSDDEMGGPVNVSGIDMESNYPIDGDDASFAPLNVGEERDISPAKDGGVVKKLLVAGEGFKSPEKGDEVTGASRRGAAEACRSAFERLPARRRAACGPLTRRARSALRGHAAGRHGVRQQPRARLAVRLPARRRCARACARRAVQPCSARTRPPSPPCLRARPGTCCRCGALARTRCVPAPAR